MCENVLTACDFHPGRGRKKHSVLGNERVQMDTAVCTQIVGLVIENLTADGGVLEPGLEDLYTATGRRKYAQKILYGLSKFRTGVVSEVPEEALYKTLGDLIKIGKSSPPGGGRAEMRYVGKAGAGAVELTACWNVERKKHGEASVRHSQLSDKFAGVLPNIQPGKSFEEICGEAVVRYHQRPQESQPSGKKSKS